MKVVPFNVPHLSKEAFRSQVDEKSHFYDELHAHPEIQLMLILFFEIRISNLLINLSKKI